MKQAIVFDLDGTLLHSAPDVLASLERALGEAGVTLAAPLPETIIGPPVAGMLVRAGLDLPPEQSQAVVAAFRRTYDSSDMPLTRPYEGAVALLTGLRAAGRRIYLATNKPSRPTRALVARHFEGLVDGLCCIDSGSDGPLSKRGMLEVLQARHGFTTPEAVMIGDGAGDVRAGRELGWSSLAVAWGYGTREELLAEGPDALLEGFPELSHWLEHA